MATGTVNASSLNLRTAPDGPVIATLPRGTTVTTLGEQGTWLQVDVNGTRGFVSARFIQRTAPAAPPQIPAVAKPGDVRLVGSTVLGPDGVVFARVFRLGCFTTGKTTLIDFISNHGAQLTVSPSLLRVMQAVSANEGRLEAINTWDNAFLTFGALQWTVGAADAGGELAALLDRTKQGNAAAFAEYFGRHRLDVGPIKTGAGVVPTGTLLLDGKALATAAAKEQLRTHDWAYRFWRAGHDPEIRSFQVQHAIGRLDTFYREPRKAIRTRVVSDYVSSEYGVALLFDQHVNRPGHVPSTLAKALEELALHVDVSQPQNWTDHEERELLDLYVEHRAMTNMTDSNKRAEAIRRAVQQGLISDRRGSFAG
jgi:hypothetical protein